MRITGNGDLHYCRWANSTADSNIRDVDIREYFQNHMADIRRDLLAGKSPESCWPCHEMESYGKVSGRQRQLIKIGVIPDHWAKSLRSSPLWSYIYQSKKSGRVDRCPVDWQIDLGNHCNSACVFCIPEYSSKVAKQWQTLGIETPPNQKSWSQDPKLLQTFVEVLSSTQGLSYLHFIGGETLVTPGFVTILDALIDAGLSQEISIGFTTNLTVWNQDVVDKLLCFRSVNLGMSIETLDRVNDYVRWPSVIDRVRETMDRWLGLAHKQQWYTSLRITPTVLTVSRLLPIYELAHQRGLVIESCNFLQHPEFMRPSVLPKDRRLAIADVLDTWVQQHGSHAPVINVRNPNTSQAQITQDASSYSKYLRQSPDESHRMPDLVSFLKKLESIRNNCVLDYLPEYEDIFRSAGY